MKTRVLILLFVSLCTSAFVEAQQNAPTSDDCRDLDVVSYASPDAVPLKERIIITKVTEQPVSAPAGDEETGKRSPQGTARLIFLDQPDFMKKGPWSTKARIVGNKAHPLNLAIEFRDHANQAVYADWLNEKLLFLRVWRGRLVSTDLILNVDTGEPIYVEEASYHNLVMPCDEKRRTHK
jgi:hypothetical protein